MRPDPSCHRGRQTARSATGRTVAECGTTLAFAYVRATCRNIGLIPIDVFLAGGNGERDNNVATPGVKAFEANLLAWGLSLFTTCANEGFTSSRLTLCRQICEIDQTPTRLTRLIRLYMTAYRSEPPCAD